MRNGRLMMRAYQSNGKSEDFCQDWLSEEPLPCEREYAYNEALSNRDNAAILVDIVVAKLRVDPNVISVDPHPNAVSLWGEEWFGTDVFYQNQEGTMKVAARVRTK